jgi:2-oxoisovalerate dehydrogenase E1 component alpha subunit
VNATEEPGEAGTVTAALSESGKPRQLAFAFEAAPSTVESIQVLGVEGRLNETDDNSVYFAAASRIPEEHLVRMHRDMVVAGDIDSEAPNLQRQGEIGLWPPLFGQ